MVLEKLRHGDESDYFDDSGQKLRGVKELLLVGRREIARGDIDKRWTEKVENSENVFCLSLCQTYLS